MKVSDLIGNETGIRGELEAIDFLKEAGYTVVAANVVYKGVGELDVIAKDGNTLVIVEVKNRESHDYGHPLESITRPKITKIVKAAELYISETNQKFDEVRFDVIAIYNDNIEHIKDAFYGLF